MKIKEIKIDKKLPNEFIVKYAFKKPVFAVSDIRGKVVDEILDKRGFNVVEMQQPDGIIIFRKNNNSNPIQNRQDDKLLEVAKEYIRFSSFVGEKFPFLAEENIKFILNQINTPPSSTFGVAINQNYFLSADNLKTVLDNFFNFKCLDFVESKEDVEFLKQTNYTTTFFANDMQINVALDVINSTSAPAPNLPNVQLMIDCISLDGTEISEKVIKKRLEYIFDLTKKMGFEI